MRSFMQKNKNNEVCQVKQKITSLPKLIFVLLFIPIQRLSYQYQDLLQYLYWLTQELMRQNAEYCKKACQKPEFLLTVRYPNYIYNLEHLPPIRQYFSLAKSSAFRIFRNQKTQKYTVFTADQISQGYFQSENYQFIGSLFQVPNPDQIEKSFLFEPSHSCLSFLSLRNYRSGSRNNYGYQLVQKDTILLGDTIFHFVRLSSKSTNQWYNRSFVEKNIAYQTLQKQKNELVTIQLENWEGYCKYCFSSDIQSQDDFFISPCSCKGTCSLIHFQCLRSWAKDMVVVMPGSRSNRVLSFCFDKFKCQVCHSPLARTILRKNLDEQCLFNWRRYNENQANPSYLIIQPQKSNFWYYAQIKNGQQLNIGRNYMNDIIINSEYISYNHCTITNVGGSYFLNDLNSKNGTYIALKHETFINSGIDILSSNNDFISIGYRCEMDFR